MTEEATYPITLPHFVSSHQNEAHLSWKNKQSSAVHHAMLAWDYEQISRHYMDSFFFFKYRVMTTLLSNLRSEIIDARHRQ